MGASDHPKHARGSVATCPTVVKSVTVGRGDNIRCYTTELNDTRHNIKKKRPREGKGEGKRNAIPSSGYIATVVIFPQMKIYTSF